MSGETHEEKLDIHVLRGTCASRLARAGVPLVHAHRLLGHSDPKITAQRYTHLGVEGLRGAMACLNSQAAFGPARSVQVTRESGPSPLSLADYHV